FRKWFVSIRLDTAAGGKKACHSFRKNSAATLPDVSRLSRASAFSLRQPTSNGCAPCRCGTMSDFMSSLGPWSNCAYYGISHSLHPIFLVHDSRGVHHVLFGVSAVCLSEHSTHQPGHAPPLSGQISLGTAAGHGEAHHHPGLLSAPEFSAQPVVDTRPGQPPVGTRRTDGSLHASSVADRRLLGRRLPRHYRHARGVDRAAHHGLVPEHSQPSNRT